MRDEIEKLIAELKDAATFTTIPASDAFKNVVYRLQAILDADPCPTCGGSGEVPLG